MQPKKAEVVDLLAELGQARAKARDSKFMSQTSDCLQGQRNHKLCQLNSPYALQEMLSMKLMQDYSASDCLHRYSISRPHHWRNGIGDGWKRQFPG